MQGLSTVGPCNETARVSAISKSVTAARAIPTALADAPHVVPGGYDRVASTLALKPLLQEFGVELAQVLAPSGLPTTCSTTPTT
jgi:hypothetical protein